MDGCWTKLFPGLFLLVGIVFSVIGISNVSQAGRTWDWPFVEGKVVSSQVIAGQPSRNPANNGAPNHGVSYYPVVKYEFSVDGNSYLGDQVFVGRVGLARRSSAQAIVGKYRPNQSVTVYYDPVSPSQCVLERGAQWSTYFFVFIGAGLGAVALLIAVIAPIGLRAEKAKKARLEAYRKSQAATLTK